MKRILIVLLAVMVLAGCSPADEDFSMDITAFYYDFSSHGYFAGEISPVMESNLANVFGDIGFKDAVVGSAAGVSADMLAVFETDDMGSLEKMIDYYLEDSREKYENYQPEEVMKLDHAVKVVRGRYLILYIGDYYSEAEHFINDYIDALESE